MRSSSKRFKSATAESVQSRSRTQSPEIQRRRQTIASREEGITLHVSTPSPVAERHAEADETDPRQATQELIHEHHFLRGDYEDDEGPEFDFARPETVRSMPDLLDLLNLDSDLESDAALPGTRNHLSSHMLDMEDELQDEEDLDPHARPYDPNSPEPLHPSSLDGFLLVLGIWADAVQCSANDWTMLVECLQLATTLEMIRSLPKSIKTLKRYRRHLPLTTLRKKPVQLDKKKIPVGSSIEGFVYYFSRQEIIYHSLEEKCSFEKMYFGPALLVDHIQELYHGTLWAESIRCASGYFPYYPNNKPIFPSDCIIFTNVSGVEAAGMITGIWRDERLASETKGGWLCTIQPLLSHSQLPDDFKNSLPFISNEVYLVDETLWISSQHIQRRIEVRLDGRRSDHGSMYVLSIINASDPRTRAIYYRHKLLAEREIETFGRQYLEDNFVLQSHLPEPKRILTVPTLDFIDGFGIYRNMYRSLLGVYVTPANLSQSARRKQRNQHTLTLGPFAARFDDVVAAIAPDLKIVDRGIDFVLNGEAVFVCSFPLAFIGDMPQANAHCGNLEPKANRFCRCCLVSKAECMQSLQGGFNQIVNARYQSVTIAARNKCLTMTESRRAQELASQGLSPCESPWRSVLPAMDPVRQCPWDFNHIEVKGLCERYMDCIFWSLNESGKSAMGAGFHAITLPHGWSRLQNPVTHAGSFGITEKGRFTVLLPFVLKTHMLEKHLKDKQRQILLEEFSTTEAIPTLISLYVALSQSLMFGLQNSLSQHDIQTVEASFLKTRHNYLKLNKVFLTMQGGKAAVEKLQRFPNLHGGIHLLDDIRRFGTHKNVNTTLGEERHKIFKAAAPFTNVAKNVNLQLLRRMNVLQSVQALADGAYENRSEYRWVNDVIHELRTKASKFFITIASRSEQTLLADEELYDAGPLFRGHRTNVKARAKIPSRQFEHALNLKDKDVQRNFIQAYHRLGQDIASISGSLQYYKGASFVDGDARYTCQIGTHVSFEAEPHTIVCVVAHVPRVGRGSLFLLTNQWLFLRKDDVLECRIYTRKRNTNLIPFSAIDNEHPHLIGFPKDETLAWRNDNALYFH